MSRVALIILLSYACAVLCAIILYFLIRKSNSSDQPSKYSTTIRYITSETDRVTIKKTMAANSMDEKDKRAADAYLDNL